MDSSNLIKDTLKKIFAEGKRFDGRGLLDSREIEVTYDVSNKAEGSARVKLGKTEVIAGVKLAVGEPYSDSKNAGNLVVSGELLPIASPKFESGPPGFGDIELPRLIDRMLRESGFMDLKKFCIKEGEKVWNIFVDVYPINDDGALIDASSLACVAALKNTVFPGINEDGKEDYKNRTSDKIPLSKETLPISLTFYKIGNSFIFHPTREEEEACESKITLGVSKWNGQYMVNSCQKGWEAPLTKTEIETIADMLPKKYEEIMERFKKFLKQ